MANNTPAIPLGVDNQLRRVLENMAETSDVGAGLRGRPEDRYIKVGDLIDMNIAKRLSAGAQRLVSGQNLVATNAPVTDTPPQPKNLVVTGGLGMIFLTWDNPLLAYTNHSYTSIYRAETDNLSSAIEVQQSDNSGMASDVTGTYGVTYYYWIKFVSNLNISGAWNSAAGTSGELAQDPAMLLAILTGVITEEQLFGDLQSRINLIDAPSTGLVSKTQANINAITSEAAARLSLAQQLRGDYTGTDGSQLITGLLKNERTSRENDITQLATQMALLSAGSATQFDYALIWRFDSGSEGFIGNGSPTTPSAGWLRPANHATAPYVESLIVTVDGTAYTQIRARIKKVGSPAWLGQALYLTATDSVWGANSKSEIHTEPAYDSGVGLVTWTMPTPWVGASIKKIRVALSTNQDASNYFEIDWIAIGRPSAGASSAELFSEQTVRAAADSALSSGIAALNVTLGTKASGSALSALDVRVASTEGVNTSQATALTTLNSTVGGHTASISAQQTTINGVAAQYMVKTDVNGLVSGFGLYNNGATSSFGINANTFYIGSPNQQSLSFVINNGKVVMNAAHIADLTITGAKIADSAISSAKIEKATIIDAHIGTLTVDTILGDVSKTYAVTQGGTYQLYAGIARAIGTIVIPARSRPQGLAVYVEGRVSTGNVAIVAEFYELLPPSLTDVIGSWTMTSQMLWKYPTGQLEYVSTTAPPSAMSGIQVGEKLTITGDGSTTFIGTVSSIVNAGGGGTYATTISFSDAVLVGSLPSSGLTCRRYPLWKMHATKIAVSISSYAPSSSSYSAAGYDTGSRLTLGRIIYCTLRAAGAVATYTKVTIVAGR